MARSFRISDLWWDDRSPGGRVALWWARRKSSRLYGRRSYTRQPVTYDRMVTAYGDGLWWVLKTLLKVTVGIVAAVLLMAVGFMFYVVATT